MLGITLVSSCAPKAGIHHLGDPCLLGNVSLGFGGALFYENLRFLLYFCVLLAGLGGCPHMFRIALGTSSAPKDGPHHLGGPVCWGVCIWLVFGSRFVVTSQVSFIFFACSLLWLGGCSHMFGVIQKQSLKYCFVFSTYFILFPYIFMCSPIFLFFFVWRCRNCSV